MSDQRKLLGKRGEDDAVRFLRNASYTILFRNYRCLPRRESGAIRGEIDLIANRGDELLICEVKSRTTNQAFDDTAREATMRQGVRQILRLRACMESFVREYQLLNYRRSCLLICQFYNSQGELEDRVLISEYV